MKGAVGATFTGKSRDNSNRVHGKMQEMIFELCEDETFESLRPETARFVTSIYRHYQAGGRMSTKQYLTIRDIYNETKEAEYAR